MEQRKKLFLKSLVRSYYDEQKLRIEVGNRLVGNVKVTMGATPGISEDEMPKEAKDLLNKYLTEYKRLADMFATNKIRGKLVTEALRIQGGVIATAYEYELAKSYLVHLEREQELEKNLGYALEEFPIWTKYLKGVKGCGVLMSSVILSELDPYKARHASSFWKYTGLDVAEDGKGRSRKAEHLVKVKYTNKDGKEDERNSITFNPFLKTKLVGVLGSCFLRCTSSPYKAIYANYKNRLENHEVYKASTKGHRHNMAIRYIIKMFLRDLWVIWREIEGLPVTQPYHETKLGIVHGVDKAVSQ